MLNGVNMDQVREYNKSLKECRDKAAKIEAGIEINEAELNRLCGELSKALNMTVTPDNIENIRDEYIKKINNTLETGMDILNRIKAEEQQNEQIAQTSVNTQQAVQNVTMPNLVSVHNVPNVAQPVQPVQNVMQSPVVSQKPVSEANFVDINSIPSIFSL